MPNLSGLVSLITGAGSGIGRASALQMAASGSAIMCADIDGDSAKDTAAAIAEHGGTAAAIALDVSSEAAVIEALQKTVRDLGGLNVIFNNAGVGGAVGWERTIAVNLTGVYNGLFHGAELLSQRGGGVIINTASVSRSAWNRVSMSTKVEPCTGSPPIPTTVDWPRPRWDNCHTAS
mgnify:CR=1 FL=1